MRFFLDTEFMESPGHLELLSIAIVAEDGREFYSINRDANFSQANPWVRRNVMPRLLKEWSQYAETMSQIRTGILELIPPLVIPELDVPYDKPEFWGYYADYDWVVFCWIFGAMVDLPNGYPMYCRDLKQILDMDAGGARIPKQPEAQEHHALNDARWNRDTYDLLVDLKVL